MLAVSSDGTAKLWDCGSAKCLDTLMTTGSAINACTLATDTSLLEKNGLPPEGELGFVGIFLARDKYKDF